MSAKDQFVPATPFLLNIFQEVGLDPRRGRAVFGALPLRFDNEPVLFTAPQ